ncbi:MAG: hypothetical protein JNM07_12350 [Phycisphaerae bacterium]|nr:hypothetical protein [Phycisphaerae bacterium]
MFNTRDWRRNAAAACAGVVMVASTGYGWIAPRYLLCDCAGSSRCLKLNPAALCGTGETCCCCRPSSGNNFSCACRLNCMSDSTQTCID